MKISLNWISDFIQIDQRDPQKFASKVAEHCFEVEKIIDPSAADGEYKFSNVFVAKVLEQHKHPNADRLRVVRLELGEGKIIEPVVCGANNFDAGDLVALALPGAIIPQDVHTGSKEPSTLGQAKIRGVESQGMICSAFELALADEPETAPVILIVDKSATVGQPLAEYLSSKSGKVSTKVSTAKKDLVFDLALPANRPDLHSHLGIAREFVAILGARPTKAFAELEKKYGAAPKVSTGSAKTGPKTSSVEKITVDIKDKAHCPYYLGAKISVKVAPSPEFIQQRLMALGMRPINNVVDITNYVMASIGQPMHAFDAGRLHGAAEGQPTKIIVRSATKGESIITLDHKQRTLTEGMLVIADAKKPLAIAGIMGGAESEISNTTTDIILESANFEPFNIRKTSKALNLRTDASALWEKGLHPRQAILGFNLAIELLRNYADAKVIAIAEAGKQGSQKHTIKFSTDQINNILGSEYNTAYIKKTLTDVGMKISGAATQTAEIPYYRSDMENYADLADEILRVTGMNNIERKPLQIKRVNGAQHNQSANFDATKEQMAMFGFNEVQNYSFVSEADLKKFDLTAEGHLKVKNPLSSEQAYLNKYPIVPLIKNVALNAKHSNAFRLFEISKSYHAFMDEEDSLGFVIYDESATAEMLLGQAKGVVDALTARYTTTAVEAKEKEPAALSLWLGNQEIGYLGMTPPQYLANFDITHPVAFAKINLKDLWALNASALSASTQNASTQTTQTKFQHYSKLPSKVLDISLAVPKETQWEDILDLIHAEAGPNLRDVQLFEAPHLYATQKLPRFHKELAEKGLKNLAFHMVFQAENSTLKDSEILPIYAKIQARLKSELNAEIR